MAAKPTILLLTADDPASRLSALAAEVNHIQRTLNSVPGRQYEVVPVQQASAQDLVDEFNVPGRSIEAIHYAGHADSRQLILADGKVEAEALAERIRHAGTVRFVFLNGCATDAQVNFFHEAGVPFVIGTVRKVGDEQAAWVARQCYTYLANRRPLRDAVNMTEADDRLVHRRSFSGSGAGRNPWAHLEDEEEESTAFAWGLRIQTEVGEDTDYTLPIRPLEPVSDLPIRHFLEGLVYALRASTHPRLSPVRELAELLERGSEVSEEAMKDSLSKVLPFTLSVRLQQILAKPEARGDDYFRELAYDHAIFFETLLHHAVSVLLAHIWNKRVPLPEEGRKQIGQYLCEDRLTASPDSYRTVLAYLTNWLSSPDRLGSESVAFASPVLVYLDSNDFREAADFFFLQKQNYQQRLRLKEEEVLSNCVLAQQYIEQAMPAFSFLLENLMVSIRDIDVRNLRYQGNTEYDNIYYKLSGNKASRLAKPHSDPSENKSVLYFQADDFEVGVESLNLFPFIFDRNVFADKTNERVDLYLFCGYFPPPGKEHACFHFFSVQSPGRIWCFDEQERAVSLLHLGEEANQVDRANNLMVKTGELKKYLTLFKEFFIENHA